MRTSRRKGGAVVNVLGQVTNTVNKLHEMQTPFFFAPATENAAELAFQCLRPYYELLVNEKAYLTDEDDDLDAPLESQLNEDAACCEGYIENIELHTEATAPLLEEEVGLVEAMEVEHPTSVCAKDGVSAASTTPTSAPLDARVAACAWGLHFLLVFHPSPACTICR